MNVRFGDEPDVVYEYGVHGFTFDVVQYCHREAYVKDGQYDRFDDNVVSDHLEDRCFDISEGRFKDTDDVRRTVLED